MTKTSAPAPVNLATVIHESEEAAKQAAEALAKAQAAQQRAQDAQQRAEQQRNAAAKRYALDVRSRNKETRPEKLKAVTDAKAAFAKAVLAGEPFGPAFLEVAKANADLYAHELEYADALGFLGQSVLNWPEPRRINVAAALAEVLEPEASHLSNDAAAAMKERKQAWINDQLAGEDA